MDLTAFLGASLPIRIHVLGACSTVLLGLAQFLIRRGSPAHRFLGWSWILAMAVTALSSFLIQELRVVGPWSPIHLLSILALVTLYRGVREARLGNWRRHGRIMASLFVFAVLLTGAFTLLPGRLMHTLLFS